MIGLKVQKKNGQEMKASLIKQGILDTDYKVKNEGDFIIFPLIKKVAKKEIVETNFVKARKPQRYQDLLEDNKEELQGLPTSYDIIGDIIIVEIAPALHSRRKEIAKAILGSAKSVETVLGKKDFFSGEFRTRELEYLAGQDKRETTYTENGVRLLLDVEKVYFSPRLSTERKRVAGLVKKGEDVLVMFSGCGPYPLVIAKNSQARSVVGIEKNPVAHYYALKNIALNKTSNVEFILGDAREGIPDRRFDRIVMPLPKDAADFLDVALTHAKEGAVIHFYDFQEDPSITAAFLKKKIKGIEILDMVKCGQFSPGKFRVCVDFKVYAPQLLP